MKHGSKKNPTQKVGHPAIALGILIFLLAFGVHEIPSSLEISGREFIAKRSYESYATQVGLINQSEREGLNGQDMFDSLSYEAYRDGHIGLVNSVEIVQFEGWLLTFSTTLIHPSRRDVVVFVDQAGNVYSTLDSLALDDTPIESDESVVELINRVLHSSQNCWQYSSEEKLLLATSIFYAIPTLSKSKTYSVLGQALCDEFSHYTVSLSKALDLDSSLSRTITDYTLRYDSSSLALIVYSVNDSDFVSRDEFTLQGKDFKMISRTNVGKIVLPWNTRM